MNANSEAGADDAQTGHPISVVAARTGLSRDVLRVWERRYGAVDPMRTSGGQRLYSDDHVHRFRLLAAATRHGRNIGLVAKLGDAELSRLVAEDDAALSRPGLDDGGLASRIVDTAMDAIMALDAPTLDRLLRRAIARNGVPLFLEDLVPALMRTIGDGWATGRLTIPHEHLASAVVIAIVLETIRAAPSAPSAPRLLVATPSGERHAVGAALSAAAASVDGWSIVYLGADVPSVDIATAAAATDARAVALSIVYVEDRATIVAEVRGLRDKLDAAIPLLIGGAGVAGIARDVRAPGVTVSESIAELRAHLAREMQSR
ncbi:MAG: MerR family transcriptional regulator [Gemmatimonadales bacterium]